MQSIMRIIFTIISEELDYIIFYKFLVNLSYTVAQYSHKASKKNPSNIDIFLNKNLLYAIQLMISPLIIYQ